MSTRRPRVKAAAILKPRRPQTSANETDGNKISPQDEANESTARNELNDSGKCNTTNETSLPITSNQETKPDVKPIVPIVDIPLAKPSNRLSQKIDQNNTIEDTVDAVENKPPVSVSQSKAAPKSSNLNTNSAAPPTPFHRISTPPVNVLNRRKSLIATDNRPHFGSPKYMKSPSYSFVQSRDTKPTTNHSSQSSAKSANADDEIFSPAPPDNDECFKSPFMSPIYTRRNDPSMSPFHDIYGDDCTKSPSAAMPNSNTKIRQRIRPTPCFANRRNSIQGSGPGAESEDEQHRRQRHYSTSSNHSSYNPATTPQHQRNYFGLNKVPSRIRTESYSSSISDIPFSKSKRSHRSEEYQRVANAKREFNQRLNGKPPDKSRLTMYDLIYYNPNTNPMSKPAAKGDKSSDNASVSSAKTNQSRSSGSVKSEASSVKTEKPENTDAVTGPVPQLKLDANGEIILDEKSLVIETTGDKEAREMLANSDVIYDDEFSGTSGFYKRQKRTRDWLPLETLKFYRSLQTIGTDFSVMLQLFPNRSRRDLKLKFKKEEKHNMALINKALLHPKEFNVDELKLQFDKEDEEIEQKKQEWAEVRKKMASERREQINASKKRNPSKSIGRSARNLTAGDIIYENEFIALPPRAKQLRRSKRKIKVASDSPTNVKNSSNDSMLSPLSLNHNNNNHVDSLPQHTYATHKLPSFIEMMSSQKSRQSLNDPNVSPNPNANSISNSQPIPESPCKLSAPDNNHVDSPIHAGIESNGAYTNGDESLHAIDLSTTGQQMVVHGAKSAVDTDQTDNGNIIQSGNDSTIDQYIAKNPNLTFKGSGDIMNMDIIFENVSIEEDPTIGNAATRTNGVPAHVDDIDTIVASSGVKNISECQSENVHIDGVHYEIITLENEKASVVCDPADNDAIVKIADNSIRSIDAVMGDDTETIPVIGHDGSYDDSNYVYSSNEVVIMSCSTLDVAAEVETADESTATEVPLPALSPHREVECNSPEAIDTKTDVLVKDDPNVLMTVQTVDSSPNDSRKRKRKVVPVLAINKRTRRSNAANLNSGKTETLDGIQPTDYQTSDKQEQVETTVGDHATHEIQTEDHRTGEAVDESINDDGGGDNQVKSEADDVPEPNFMDSLVVVESQDPNDPNRTIHEVYVVDPETKEMSEKPLDLAADVIQRIRTALL